MRLRILSSVLLPAPLRPMIPTTSPASTPNVTSRKAHTTLVGLLSANLSSERRRLRLRTGAESAPARRTVRSCARSSPRSSRYSLDTRSTEICVTTGVLSDDVGHHVLDVVEVPE